MWIFVHSDVIHRNPRFKDVAGNLQYPVRDRKGLWMRLGSREKINHIVIGCRSLRSRRSHRCLRRLKQCNYRRSVLRIGGHARSAINCNAVPGNRNFSFYLLFQTQRAANRLFVANSGQKGDKPLAAIADKDVGFPKFGFNAIGYSAQQEVSDFAAINPIDLG